MKASLIITTYNRSAYLAQCLKSLAAADLSGLHSIIFIDDHSTDQRARQLVYDFKYPGVNILRMMLGDNGGIKRSLLEGFEFAFASADIAINLDADAIVRKDFVHVLTSLKRTFPDNIVCGFNTTVLNRNPIISEHSGLSKKAHGFFKKKYASGINMVINKEQYQKYIKPALNGPGNWDFEASKLHEKDGKAVIVATPSVIQHIGFDSSMGHAVSEPPDVAEDFFLYYLPDVTLIGATSSDLNGLMRAADISSKYIKFKDIKLLSSLPSKNSNVFSIDRLANKAEYNQFVLKHLADYFETSHCLIIQSDGYVINPYAWRDEFLKWDYIGAVWNFNHQPYSGYHVGNGGFSLRSLRLHQILRDDPLIKPTNDQYIKNFEEDHNICKIYRGYLERKYAIKFAPQELANQFSVELYGVPPPGNRYNGSFGFHGTSVDFTGCDLEHIPYSHPSRIFS